MTYRAVYQGNVIAEASEDAVKHVEGTVYFPPEAVNREFLEPSASHIGATGRARHRITTSW